MQSSQKLHVNEITKHQITTASNQEEWNNIIKVLKTLAEKNLEYDHKEKKKEETQTLCTFHRFREIPTSI